MTSLTDLYCKHADIEFPPGNVQDAIDEWAVRRIQELQADNAALREALSWIYDACGDRDRCRCGRPTGVGALQGRAAKILATDRPGAALIAERDELLAEVGQLRDLLSGAIVYDTGAAESERAIHNCLVEMGWTPPEEQNV